MAVLTSLEGDTIELMVYRHYGRQDAELLQRVLDQAANKELSAIGPILPVGMAVTMPAIPEASAAVPGAVAAAVSLWD